jgi:hypothetical protein
MQHAPQTTSRPAARDREVGVARRRPLAWMKDLLSGQIRLSPWWNPAFHVWIWFAIALTIKAVVEPVLHSTYPCFEAGTRCWWAGQDLYDAAICPHDYRYGPAFAMAMTPLALLPTWLGGLLWTWLNTAALFCSLLAMARWVLPGRVSGWREVVFLLLALLGSVRMLWSGQSNPLVFALVAGGAAALTRQRWSWAALLLAMPVHIKVWPIAAAMLLVVCRPRQLAWRFAVALLGVAALPFLTKPAAWVCQQYYGWYCLLVGPAQLRHSYRDAWTIWELIHQPVSAHGYLLLQLGTAALVLALCWRRVRQDSSTAELLTFVLALWTGWQLVFGPGTERNTFGMLAPLSAWAMIGAYRQQRGRILISLSFLLTIASTFGVIERALAIRYPAVLAAHPVGVLLFVGWLLRWGSKPQTEDITIFSARTSAPAWAASETGRSQDIEADVRPHAKPRVQQGERFVDSVIDGRPRVAIRVPRRDSGEPHAAIDESQVARG